VTTWNKLTSWTLIGFSTITIALGLASSHLLDDINDHSTEMAQSQALNDAQQQAAREFRKDMAAAKLCRETVGESSIQWTAAGSLVCVPRTGKAVKVGAL
jgi:hypothetical protein